MLERQDTEAGARSRPVVLDSVVHPALYFRRHVGRFKGPGAGRGGDIARHGFGSSKRHHGFR
jgi:hypothetical protein